MLFFNYIDTLYLLSILELNNIERPMKKDSAIVIDLDKLEKTSPIEEKELIYKESYEQLKARIVEKTSCNVKEITNSDVETVTYQPCFFINGERGSGKSTLLRVLGGSLCNHSEHKIDLLADIDQTELADTEMFFIHILGRVHKYLKKIKSDCMHEETYSRECTKVLVRDSYNCIKMMSRGLGMIARNPKDMNGGNDADYFIQESIRECVSGSMLKQCFAKLVNNICKISGVEVLLVTIDDADMNFSKCKDVFETVRKYLVTPRMLFIFAGDLKLYTEVVRGMQISHFEKRSFKYDKWRSSNIFGLVDNLEDQYIMKLFPAENRINLSDFGSVLARPGGLICKTETIEVNVLEYLDRDLKECLVGYETIDMLKFIEMFSIRSALQLLKYWIKHIRKENSRETNLKHLSTGISIAVSQALIKHNVYEKLGDGRSLVALMKSILLHVKQLNIGASGVCMLPGMGTESLQKVSFFLSSEVNRQIVQMGDVIEYVMNVFPYLIRYRNDGLDDDKLTSHLNFNSTKYRGELCTNVILGLKKRNSRNKTPFFNGVIPLSSKSYEGNSPFLKRISCNEYLLTLSEYVEENINVDNIIYYLAIYHSLSSTEDDGALVVCLSVYNLLSMVKHLLNLSQNEITNENVKRLLIGDGESFLTMIDDSDRGEKVKKARSEYVNVGVAMYETLLKLSENDVFVSAIDKIVKWLTDCLNISCRVNAQSLYECWKRYYAKCVDITVNSKLRSINWGELVRASSLYSQYLKAFSNSFDSGIKYLDDKSVKIIGDCPLWDIIVNSEEQVAQLHIITNKVNIAAVEISFDIDKFERFCSIRIKLSERTMLNRLNDVLSSVVKKQITLFEKWCQDIFERTVSRCYNAQNDALEREIEEVDEEKERLREKKIRDFLSRLKRMEKKQKAKLSEELSILKDNFFNDAEKLLDADVEEMREIIMAEASTVETEEIASNILKAHAKKFDLSLYRYKESVEMPMEIQAQDKRLAICAYVSDYVEKYIKQYMSE